MLGETHGIGHAPIIGFSGPIRHGSRCAKRSLFNRTAIVGVHDILRGDKAVIMRLELAKPVGAGTDAGCPPFCLPEMRRILFQVPTVEP